MSKVVHLSKSAHERAKQHCLRHGVSMSDWVASLIEQASLVATPSVADAEPVPLAAEAGEPPAEPETFAQARALAGPRSEPPRLPPRERADLPAGELEEVDQLYAAPPFWDREGSRAGRNTEAPLG